MANRRPAPFVFEDNRPVPFLSEEDDWEIQQGPRISCCISSTPDAPRQDWLGIDSSSEHEHQLQDPLPHEVQGATTVVRLAGMLLPDDLRDDVFYQEVLEDFTAEACKFGQLLEVVIPRPDDPAVSAGVGKVFLRYACLDASVRCMTSLDGRWFAGRQVVGGYYPEDRFAVQEYGYDG